MSTLFVDTINEKTSNSGVAIPGHVIQTVSYNIGQGSPAFTGSTTVTVSSGQTVIIGSGTITPKYSTSKILVTGFNTVHANTGYTYMRVMRDSTIIQTPGNAVGYQHATGTRISIPVYILDTPATTSQITYSHRVDYHGGTVNMIYNYGSCNLTLLEIAQ